MGRTGCVWDGGGVEEVLGFELVREDEVGIAEEDFVDWDDVWGDVNLTVVAHYGIEDWRASGKFIVREECNLLPNPRKMSQA